MTAPFSDPRVTVYALEAAIEALSGDLDSYAVEDAEAQIQTALASLADLKAVVKEGE